MQPRQVEQEVPAEVLNVLAHSELFRQAYDADDEDARFCPTKVLTLQDEAGVLAWSPVHHTLTQFIDSYDALLGRVRERIT